MRRQLVLMAFSFLMAANSQGQVDIKVNFREISFVKASLLYRFEDSAIFTTPFLQRSLGKDWRPFNNQVKISYIRSILWLKIPLKNISAQDEFDLLYFDNAHVNELRGWIKKTDNSIDSFPLTGDHHNFHSRGQPTTGFMFPVSSKLNQKDTLILAIEKRSSKLDVPLTFYRNAEASGLISKNYLKTGLIAGMILLLIFFNLLLFISSGEKVYFWYGLYLVAILIYYTTNEGLLFQFIYPETPGINDLIRPFALGFSMIPILFFFNQLLNIKESFPRLYTFNKFILLIYMIVATSALISSIVGDYIIQEKWLNVNSILGPLVLIIVMGESIYCSKKQIRFSVFALVSFVTYFVFISIFSLGQNGLLNDNIFVSNALYIAILIDIIVVAWSLVWRYVSFRKETIVIQQELSSQQKRIFRETSSWQKQEMQRISSFLHDNIGANLGFLRLKVDKMLLNEESRKEIGQLLTQMGTEVRQLSHQFSPLQLQTKGLQASVEDMIHGISSNSGIAIQFEWIGQEKNLDLQYEIIIYRILQELFQNLIKHAKATEAILQIMYENDTLGLYFEDNGIGSNLSQGKVQGIGLKNIEQLITQLKGRFSVTTSPGEGFSLSIEFPVIH